MAILALLPLAGRADAPNAKQKSLLPRRKAKGEAAAKAKA